MSKRLFAFLLTCSFSACSIRSYQKDGDVLYTGIKSIDIVGDKSSREADRALELAEEQLAYPPNNSILGSSSMRWPWPLYAPWLYLRFANSKTWVGKSLYRLGRKPVWIRDVNPALRAKVSERILGEHGFLSAEIQSKVIPNPKDSLEAKVAYKIRLGNLYYLDSVSYLDSIPLNDSVSLKHSDISRLRSGQSYSINSLLEDRNALSHKLREEGFYYFNPSYITYEADSLRMKERLQLRAQLKPDLSSEVMRPWRIDRVRLRFLEDRETVEQDLQFDTISIDNRITAYYQKRLPIRKKVLNARLALRPDSLYRFSKEDLMLKSLMGLGAFSGVELYYSPHDLDTLRPGAKGSMDMTVLLRPDKLWDISLGGQFVHKTTDFIGPGATLTLNRRNLLGGGEVLGFSAHANYEWQIGNRFLDKNTSYLNSYKFGFDASLSLPTLLIPGWINRYYPYNVSTTFKLSAQRLNRAGYYGLNTMSLAMSYDYQPTEQSSHNFKVLGVDYTQLATTTTYFDEILKLNPSLQLSLSSQLIPSIAYTYTWHKKVGTTLKNDLWLRASASQAGNLTKSIFLLFGKKFNDSQKILGVPYAQFVKLAAELRYTKYIDRYQSLATRLSLGAIYSYGNMLRAPYLEQFYIGGANSIRAFTVRSLGPGRFRNQANTSYTFMDHVGETKLEMNLEYRRALTQSLELALFIDAGNVWLLRPDRDREGGSLGELKGVKDFLNQIAVGTGVGLRYDFSYLLVRLDAGIGLHLPYETGKKGWYNIPKFSDGFGFHLAIGYPF